MWKKLDALTDRHPLKSLWLLFGLCALGVWMTHHFAAYLDRPWPTIIRLTLATLVLVSSGAVWLRRNP